MSELLGHYLGFIFDQSDGTPHHTGALIVEPASIALEVPLLASVTDAYDAWFTKGELPTELFFRNHQHGFYVTGLQVKQQTVNFPSGHGIGRASADRIVKTSGASTNFLQVNGVRSELDGLPAWVGGDTGIELSFESHPDNKSWQRSVAFKGAEQAPLAVPGIRGLSFAKHFNFTANRANQLYTMSHTVNLETMFTEPGDWVSHTPIHQAIQDLVSLAYWHPCDLRAVDVHHQDETMSDRPVWRPMFTPSFGRRAVGQSLPPLPGGARPLFTYEDIKERGLELWWTTYKKLQKAMQALSASLFRAGGTVEVQLLQVATALEHLGFFLATSATQQKANFEPTVQRVIDSTDCGPSLERKVLKGRTSKQWAADFNKAYKGVKHADNQLPDGLTSYNCADEGAWLARLWLARFLGTESAVIDRRTAR